ncbi:MAG: TRAP transporter small permease [Hyphomicrobiales bacterium]|nr:TRAP transporter small permease [Hyphomicrobiales bacterium]
MSLGERRDDLHVDLSDLWIVGVIVVILRMTVMLAATGMMLVTVTNVVLRYLFASPISGNDEIIQYLLAILIFAAFPIVTVNRRHFAVSLFAGRARGRALFYSHMLEFAVSLLGCAIMTWKLATEAQELFAEHMTTMVLGLPQGPLAVWMSALSGIAAMGLVMVLVRYIRSGGDRP